MIKRQKVALAEELSSDMSSHLFRATNQIQIHESMIRFFSTAKKGQKIPSELKLAEHYHVSRATIREVLQKLEFEGYLIRKKGSGTYLLNPPVNEKENLLYFFDIQSMIRAKGFLPSCDPVTIIRQPAGGYYAPILEISEQEEIILRYLLFRADGHFTVLLEDCFPSKFLSKEEEWNVVYDPDADLRMAFFYSMGIRSNRDELKLGTVDKDSLAHIRRFHPPEDIPLLYMRSLCFDEENRPIMCSQFFSNTTFIDYKINRHLFLK